MILQWLRLFSLYNVHMTNTTDTTTKKSKRWLWISFLAGFIPSFLFVVAMGFLEATADARVQLSDIFPAALPTAVIVGLLCGLVSTVIVFIALQIKKRGLFG